MFLRTVKGSHSNYLYLVEGYRENGKVKHRNLVSFGKVEDLDPEQLKDIAIKLLEFCPNSNLIDIDQAEESSRKNWGIPKVIDKLWEKFALDAFFTKLLSERQLKYDLVSAVKLMLADRLSHPCSKYKTYLNKNYYDALSGEELHNLYRSLNELNACKNDIEKHLFEQNKLHSHLDLNVVFFDVTTFYFESIKQDELRNFGYGKDGKFNEVQVVMSLLVTADGIPIGFDLFPGNTYEGHTLTNAIKKLKTEYNIKKIVVVADKGLNSGLNLHELVQEDFEYIVGSRLKNLSSHMKKKVLAENDYIAIQMDEDGAIVFKYKVIDYNKNVKIGNRHHVIQSKLVCTWSEKRSQKDKRDRERLVNKAIKIIREGDSAQVRGAKKYLINTKEKNYKLNEEKILEDTKWDGFYGIETSDAELTPEMVLNAYKQLWKIEESFKIFKSHLETRPLYHWNPERIQGHFVLSYIAFLFERTLELQLKRAGFPLSSPEKIRDALNKMEFSELQFGGNIHKLYATLDSLGELLLNILKIPHPKKRKN